MSARLAVAPPSSSSTSVRNVELRWLFVSASDETVLASRWVTSSTSTSTSSSLAVLDTLGSELGILLLATSGSGAAAISTSGTW